MAEPNARSLIELAREEASPSERQVEDLLARLSGPPGPGDGGEPEAVPNGTGWGTVALVLIVAAGIVGLALILRPADDTPPPNASTAEQGVAAAPSEHAPPVESTTVDTQELAVVALEAGVATGREPSVDPDPATTRPPSARTNVPKPSPPKSRRRDERQSETGAPETSPDGNDLAAEFALVRRMRDALRDKKWPTVASLVREHGTRFPRGQMRPEVEAMSIVARCETASADAAAQMGRRSLAKGHSPYARRIAEACGLPLPE